MTDQEIRLRCLELALEQVKREGIGGKDFREAVADSQTWFYNRIVETPVTGQGQKSGRQKDKPPEMFR